MKKLLVCAIGCAMLLLIGCGGGGSRASMWGTIDFWWVNADSVGKWCIIEGHKCDGFKIIPVITINEDTLPTGNTVSLTNFGFADEVTNLDDGDECKLKVDYDEGKAEATDTVPGEFVITEPDSSAILHKGNSLDIEWESSDAAQWYRLYVDIEYDYLDSNSYWQDFYYELDTIIEGTSHTISASTLFPSDVDTILSGNGEVYVTAVNGPKPEQGEEGNIKGDAVGFFWCSYSAKPIYFGVEQLAQRPKKERSAEIRKRHLEELREFATENEQGSLRRSKE